MTKKVKMVEVIAHKISEEIDIARKNAPRNA
jgi:hypothetical protein